MSAMLAGCSEDAAPPVEDDDFADVEVDEKATTGAISGVVVSETIVPIEGAIVSLAGQTETVTTNAEGQFAFEDLAPGAYFVSATAETYLDAQTNVEVVAGSVVTPRIMLAKDPAPQPYIASEQFNGHMVLSDYLVIYTLSDVLGNNDLCRCEFLFTSDPDVKTVVFETFWDSSYNRVEEHDMYWDFWGDNGGHTSKWILSGDIWHIDGSGFDGGETGWRALISSGEQPDVEQSFEGFVTFWHVDAAPADWSING